MKTENNVGVFTREDWIDLLGHDGRSVESTIAFFRNAATERDSMTALFRILKKESILRSALDFLMSVDELCEYDWMISGGAVCRTIWNAVLCKPLNFEVRDVDVPYWNSDDLSEESEARIAALIEVEVNGILPESVDVKNEARAHIWRTQKFGYPSKPYTSLLNMLNRVPFSNQACGIGHYHSNSIHDNILGNGLNLFGFGSNLTEIFALRCEARNGEAARFRKGYIYNKLTEWLKYWNELEFDFSELDSEPQQYFNSVYESLRKGETV